MTTTASSAQRADSSSANADDGLDALLLPCRRRRTSTRRARPRADSFPCQRTRLASRPQSFESDHRGPLTRRLPAGLPRPRSSPKAPSSPTEVSSERLHRMRRTYRRSQPPRAPELAYGSLPRPAITNREASDHIGRPARDPPQDPRSGISPGQRSTPADSPRVAHGVFAHFSQRRGVYEHSRQTRDSTNAGLDPAHRRPADDSQQRATNSNLAALAATKRQQHAVAGDVRHRARTRHRASVRDQLSRTTHGPGARRTAQPSELRARAE